MEKRERRFGPSVNLVESLVGHTPTDGQWSDSLTRVPLKKSTGQIHNLLHWRPPSPPSLQIHEYGHGCAISILSPPLPFSLHSQL